MWWKIKAHNKTHRIYKIAQKLFCKFTRIGVNAEVIDVHFLNRQNLADTTIFVLLWGVK